jgi:hypothetical protein
MEIVIPSMVVGVTLCMITLIGGTFFLILFIDWMTKKEFNPYFSSLVWLYIFSMIIATVISIISFDISDSESKRTQIPVEMVRINAVQDKVSGEIYKLPEKRKK